MENTLISCELLGDLPRLAAEQWTDRIALNFKDRTWSYRNFEAEVKRLAKALIAAGVKPGDRVALWLPNSPELQFLMFAITRVGAIAVPLNTRYKSMDLSYALRHSGSVMVIGAPRAGPVDLAGILASALGESSIRPDGELSFSGMPALRAVVMTGDSTLPGHIDWPAFIASGEGTSDAETWRAVSPQDTALMLFTSGTTGNPKAVLLDHAGLRLCRDRAQILNMSADDVQLTYLPLFHIYAFGYSVLMSFMSGASQVLMEVFNGEEALRLMHQHRVTVIHGFDAHFMDLLAARKKLGIDVPHMRIASFASGAESMRKLAERVQTELCETSSSYGLTELWGGISISPPGATLSQRCEASGLPQPGIEVRIVDAQSGRVLPPDTLGEIQVRSYAMLQGYHEDPEATRAALDEGWFRTGDAGVIREDGYLRCLARYKDMLKVGGENVAPAEIEALIGQIPGIRAAAVVGQKDTRLQEVPVAFVVADEASSLTEAEVITHFRGKVANFKIPARVVFVDELPMTPTGKVQKEVLRRRLEADDRTN